MAGEKRMNYQYWAKAANGKTVRGRRAADNESELLEWIRDKGWIPINVVRTYETVARIGDSFGKNIDWKEVFDFSPRVKLRDKAIFIRQLSTMIAAGVPIGGALQILIEQTNQKRLKKIIQKIYARVSSGSTLSSAIAEHPKFFDVLISSLIRSGEESGTLDSTLAQLANFIEDQEVLKKKIISAMTYPAVVITIAVFVLGIMVVVVIPQFQKAFSSMNVELPRLTRMIFEFGTWAQSYWYYAIAVIGLIILLLNFLRKVPGLRIYIDTGILKVPVFGDILYKAALSRSFRTMSALLRSGVPILKALEMAGEVASNSKINNNFLLMRDAAAMGAPMNIVIKERKLFPPMIAHMIAVGEETGRTDEMLQKISDWYDNELSEKIKRLSSVLEPIMVVLVGIIVGFMVLAIFLPIISAIQQFM
ncbi:MAG: type II secretion system F family protein [Synergistetes bacterium HGW-Synergistetes-1]|nr:MAG: type II secretion system F family protein [Synergistetes bacterium HGW-Synergistetes-1]